MKKPLAILSAAVISLAACSPGNPVLSVEGGLVQGVECEPGITVFKGIPYAAAPVGELRWKAPAPVEPWEGVRVCDTFGAPSIQSPHTPGGYTPEFFFDGDPQFSEDCLYLNVWTPAAGKPERKLPVCLWVHGGAFVAGWGHEPEMDGIAWARQDCILVSFNYRLGVLGFLAHPALSAENPDAVSGNYGLLDQIAALKWVKANIAQFGGDPGRITIMGQSAGAKSVKLLATSPLSRDLVSGVIIQSGGGITDVMDNGSPLQECEINGSKLMDWMGLGSLEQMRTAPAEAFEGANYKYMAQTGEWLDGVASPIVDGVVLPKLFGQAAADAEIADVPYMIGGTLDDIAGLDKGIRDFCLLRDSQGGVAYAYHFDRPLPTDGRPDVLEGAFHSSELWYMFGSQDNCWRPFTEGDRALSNQMVKCWTDFVKHGNPGCGWTPCTATSPRQFSFRLDERDAVASQMTDFAQ